MGLLCLFMQPAGGSKPPNTIQPNGPRREWRRSRQYSKVFFNNLESWREYLQTREDSQSTLAGGCFPGFEPVPSKWKDTAAILLTKDGRYQPMGEMMGFTVLNCYPQIHCTKKRGGTSVIQMCRPHTTSEKLS